MSILRAGDDFNNHPAKESTFSDQETVNNIVREAKVSNSMYFRAYCSIIYDYLTMWLMKKGHNFQPEGGFMEGKNWILKITKDCQLSIIDLLSLSETIWREGR